MMQYRSGREGGHDRPESRPTAESPCRCITRVSSVPCLPIAAFAVTLSFLALPALSAEEPAGILFSLSSWEIGPIERGTVVTHPLELSNRDGTAHRVMLMSTCGCLTVEPRSVSIPPGGSVTITLTLDSALESGEFEKILIVRSTHPALPKAAFAVRGTALEPRTQVRPVEDMKTPSPD